VRVGGKREDARTESMLAAETGPNSRFFISDAERQWRQKCRKPTIFLQESEIENHRFELGVRVGGYEDRIGTGPPRARIEVIYSD